MIHMGTVYWTYCGATPDETTADYKAPVLGSGETICRRCLERRERAARYRERTSQMVREEAHARAVESLRRRFNSEGKSGAPSSRGL